jgi:hypothetical protein
MAATTAPDGGYRFNDIKAGSYTVTEEDRSGWVHTTPNSVNVSVEPNQTANTNFGNFKLGKFSGYKWDDTDEDGIWDQGEPPLEGWKINLKKPDGNTNIAYTDEHGYYQFTGLRYGTYEVSEEIPEEWVQTCPGNPEAPDRYTVLIKSGSDVQKRNFGNFKLGKISGYKWDDGQPPDRTRTGGEPPLSSWTIVLTKLIGDGEEVIATEETDQNGAYEFSGLHYGTYRVWEVLKDDWRQTTPEKGDIVPPNPGYGEGCYEVEVKSGTDFQEGNFGNVELGSIEKRVFHYWWLEPMKDLSVLLEEIEVPGVLENIPPLPWNKNTDESGSALFDSLLPGKYKVTLTSPEGWIAEPPVYEHEVVLPEGDDVVVDNFIYDNPAAEPRTIGFWKNWRHNYTDADMAALIVRVKAGSQNFQDLSLNTIDAMLDTSGKKPKKRMATIQYLGTWLNLASDRLGFLPCVDLTKVSGWDQIISDDDGIMTIHELMLRMRELYNADALTDQQWEIFKNICDELNNSRLFISCPGG